MTPRPASSSAPSPSPGLPRAREVEEFGVVTPGVLEVLAELIAEKLDERQRARSRWVDADAVAEHLGVEREWVYAHSARLRPLRLGGGPRARLRFRLDLVDEVLCLGGRESDDGEGGMVEPKRRPRRRQGLGTGVPLLPIREANGGR